MLLEHSKQPDFKPRDADRNVASLFYLPSTFSKCLQAILVAGFFLKYLTYFCYDKAKFADHTSDHQCFTVGHKVHVLAHAHMLYKATVLEL